jgi:hypothetical protein
MSTRKRLINGVWGVLFGLIAMAASPALILAHEAKCPHCELDLTQNTPEQDNEVVLKFGKKRIEYKCVLCAIADAEKSYTGDLTVLAPTEIKGKPVEITRKDGKWTATESTVFIGHKVKHRYCDRGYRAFTSRAAFDAHVQKNKGILRDAQPIGLDEMVQISKNDILQKKKMN